MGRLLFFGPVGILPSLITVEKLTWDEGKGDDYGHDLRCRCFWTEPRGQSCTAGGCPGASVQNSGCWSIRRSMKASAELSGRGTMITYAPPNNAAFAQTARHSGGAGGRVQPPSGGHQPGGCGGRRWWRRITCPRGCSSFPSDATSEELVRSTPNRPRRWRRPGWICLPSRPQ